MAVINLAKAECEMRGESGSDGHPKKSRKVEMWEAGLRDIQCLNSSNDPAHGPR